MDDLKTEPLWRPETLGQPIPPSPYAVSVSLPTWRDNIGYEEGDPRVVDVLQAGYPRFVYPRLCRRLMKASLDRWGRPGESCLPYPTARSAGRFSEWMVRRAQCDVRSISIGVDDVHAVFYPSESAAEAKAFWQHSGEGVSPRLAEQALRALGGLESVEVLSAGANSGSPGEPTSGNSDAVLRQRIADSIGGAAEDVFLFPCGMNAAFQFHQALGKWYPGRRSAQFGFPYVDTLKIQEKAGAGAAFFPRGDDADLDRLSQLAVSEKLSAIYTEFPSNPLLNCPDLEALSSLCRRQEIPLVVDDTVASCQNVDLTRVADVVWMSLTKYFSGVGDVTGGALVLNRKGAFFDRLKASLDAVYEDLLYKGDAAALERNSRRFVARMQEINANAERLADALREHPAVAEVHFPKFGAADRYRAFQRAGAGFGGLLSLELKDSAIAAPRFFDALRVCKGPNLGMEYTLACPYTVLAHFTEFEFAESCGVSRWLIRVAVGTEPFDDLWTRFESALA